MDSDHLDGRVHGSRVPPPCPSFPQPLAPMRQGALDRLCGFYSILNAMRYAAWPLYPIDDRTCQKLFDHGAAALARSDQLRTIMRHGMPDATWHWLCDQLIAHHRKLGGPGLQKRLIFDGLKKGEWPKAMGVIDHHVSHGKPVLVNVVASYHHYTVIVGRTPARFKLFDSYGYQWLSISACGFHHKHALERHQIVRASAMTLQLAGPLKRDADR